jgi:hypothetical protein
MRHPSVREKVRSGCLFVLGFDARPRVRLFDFLLAIRRIQRTHQLIVSQVMHEPVYKTINCRGTFEARLRIDEIDQCRLRLADVFPDDFQPLTVRHAWATRRPESRSSGNRCLAEALTAMPRYFFDLTGSEIRQDATGVVLDNDAAARQEAKLRAMDGHSFRLQQYRNHHFIEVRDEGGRLVCKVAIEH